MIDPNDGSPNPDSFDNLPPPDAGFPELPGNDLSLPDWLLGGGMPLPEPSFDAGELPPLPPMLLPPMAGPPVTEPSSEDTLSEYIRPLPGPEVMPADLVAGSTPLSRTPAPMLVPTTPPPSDSADRMSKRVTIAPAQDKDHTTTLYRIIIQPDHPGGFEDCHIAFLLPTGVKQVFASHKPVARKGQLNWKLGNIAIKDAVTLSVKIPTVVIPPEERGLPRTFTISYRPGVMGQIQCTALAPAYVGVGETCRIEVCVVNTGTLPVEPVTVRATHVAGGRPQTVTTEPLAPGAARSVALEIGTVRRGRCEWLIRATAMGVLPCEVTCVTDVVEPVLAIALQHESMTRVDDDIDITVIVRNDSPVIARQVTAVLAIPEEMNFVSAVGGEYDRANSQVGWYVGDLAGQHQRTLKARVRGFAPGLVRFHVQCETTGLAPTVSVSNLFVEVSQHSSSSMLDNLLAAMDRDLPADDEVPTAAPVVNLSDRRYMVFELAGTSYAVPIENIREVIRPTRLTPVPGLPDWLPGVANVRGDVVSIVDLPRFLDVEAPEQVHRGLLISQSDDGQMVVGLLVNEVVGIRRLPQSQSLDPELLGDNRVATYLTGVSEHQNQMIPLLNLNQMLLADELNLFQSA